jgi:cell filamentation protein
VVGYTLPDGITLKNKLGATSPSQLEMLETDFVRIRLLEIELGNGPRGEFDARHLKALHQHLFQDVYEWSGRSRDEQVALSDGTIATEPDLRKLDGQPFMSGQHISTALHAIETKLKDANYLRGRPREEFAERAADLMADINAVHPFREGNGRTQRIFMEQLAREAGHSLDFRVISKERMIQASISANDGHDSSMMRRMFDEISDPPRVEMLRTAIGALQAQKFEWNNRYLATLAPGHTVELVLAGVAGDQFMARTSDQILFGRTADLPHPHPERGHTFTVTAQSREQRQDAQAKKLAFFEDRNPSTDHDHER